MQYFTHACTKITGLDTFSEKHFINKAPSFHEYFVYVTLLNKINYFITLECEILFLYEFNKNIKIIGIYGNLGLTMILYERL